MKVYLTKPRNHWLSPYTILEKVFFWREIDYDEPLIEKWADRLVPLCKVWQKFLDIVHPEVKYVKIDYWDTWSMDYTLSPIILPMLVQLQKTKHGSGLVDLEDVPEYLRTTTTEEYDDQKVFDFYLKEKYAEGDRDIHARWDWVLNEMIWTFEQLCDENNDAQFHHGVVDFKSIPCQWDENNKPTMYKMERGPNDTSHFDEEGFKKHHERIENGLRLFGKYFRNLWD